MCGIAGFIGPEDRELLQAMTDRIAHRGPDGEGHWESPQVSLGHRLLSILDHEHGYQPRANPEKSLHMTYNGEVYNYRELREELVKLGWRFETNTDTEVVLAAYEAWGVSCFARFNGMWAIAIHDTRSGTPGADTERETPAGRVVFARDHFGIKPLYLARARERLLFGSEIKALLADPEFPATPNIRSVAQYLCYGLHDHDHETFFAGVEQLRPASYLIVDLSDPLPDRGEITARAQAYDEPTLTTAGKADPSQFRTIFRRAVERRLIADVPVGTCLSGGLDSSAIACTIAELQQAQVPDAASVGEHLQTFSAVFDGDPIDEQAYIDPVLAVTGAEPYYVRPASSELFSDLPDLVWHQDEPMVSSGPYAQYRVMALAQGHSTVLLDGQGGDELLAGYVPYHYVYLRQLARERQAGRLVREAAKSADVLLPLVRAKLRDRRKGFDPIAHCSAVVAGEARASKAAGADVRSQDDLKLRLLQDLTAYSLPALLRYEDRNSMAFSIESRPPFLDQELVSYVLALPVAAIIAEGWSRAILREGLQGLLPEVIRRRRKKIGFTTPEIRWLRAERARIQGILRSPAFVARGLFDARAVAVAFRACCDGEIEESPFFWRVLNLEAWWRVFVSPEATRLSPAGRRPTSTIEAAGDEEAVVLLGGGAAREFLDQSAPNAGRHCFATGPDGRIVYGRAPIFSERIDVGADLEAVVLAALTGSVRGTGRSTVTVRAGDLVALSEKAVSVSQGRSYAVASLRTGLLARGLSRFVKRSPAGIGLGVPATMQLAIDHAGRWRILAATAAAAATRPFGVHGTFYKVAGPGVAAIDGPTPGTLPPFNTHAKLPPRDPDGVAETLAKRLGDTAGGPVSVAILDANDRGVEVLGASAGVDIELVRWLFADNPLGQGHEQTPLAIVRELGSLSPS